MAQAILRTNATPDIPITLGGDGEAGMLTRLLQPSVDVGGFRYEPAGEPVAGLGVLVFYGVLFLAGVGLYTLVRGMK